MGVSVVVTGANEAARRIRGLGGEINSAVAVVAPAIAAFGVAEVKRNASRGRPGPNVITGAFVESIQSEIDSGLLGTNIFIFSTAPQAARLEFGFYGFDSLGRYYQQPPYPSFGPSVPAITEFASAAVNTQLRRSIG